MDPIKPVLGYADRETDSSFQCDGRLIYIHNRKSRGAAYSGWVMAALMMAFPFVLAVARGSLWRTFHALGGWPWLIGYVLVVAWLIAVGFQWSTIRVDLEEGRIERTTRWGPFTGRATAPLAAFDRVVVTGGRGDDVTVALKGAARLEIVWGRGAAESVRIAQWFGEWASFPVELAEG